MPQRRTTKGRSKRTARLPSGLYAWRGRAVRFGALPKRVKFALRSGWARKAAKAAKKAKVTELRTVSTEIVVVEHTPRRGELARRGMRCWKADAVEGFTVRQHLIAVWDTAHEVFPEAEGVNWMMVVHWPDDERSEENDPFESAIGRPLHKAGVKELRNAIDDFTNTLEHPESQLTKSSSTEHASIGKGLPVLHQVWCTLHPKIRQRRKRK